MDKFNKILDKIEVASSYDDVKGKPNYKNISGTEWLAQLRQCPQGIKKGSHWIRTTLKVDSANQCLGRGNDNAASLANILIIDCDKRISSNGQEIDGAPDPLQVSNILKACEIAHILHGSYSHYGSEKGNRYRIVLITQTDYKKEQLAPTIESIIAQINRGLTALEEDLLANAVENSTWAQGWYYPRQPLDNKVEPLYLEYVAGQLVEVVEPLQLPAISHVSPRQNNQLKSGKISVIDLFNQQKNILDLLAHYAYKQVSSNRWLSPDSSSGIPGITVKDNKFFSHHDDVFNDGYWHDCWDLWQKKENLSDHDAIAQASKTLYLPNGRTVDEYNKSLSKNSLANVAFNEYQPFNNELLPVQEIPYDALPEKMEHFIKEQSEIRGCPPDFILVSVLLLFAGKIKIALMRHTNWHVTPNFFWMMVGPPSSGKTNALDATAGPIKSLSEIAAVAYGKNNKAFEQECNLLKRKLNSVMKGMDKENTKAIPDSEKIKVFEVRIKEIQQKIDDLYTKQPKCKVYTVNKTTFEKLIIVAKENPEGVMLELDEVAPLFIRLSKDENCEERGFYLTGYNGNNSYSYRTISRGEDLVERVVISIIGGTQPGKLERVVNEMKNNITNDGFLQRFQGVVYPDVKVRLAQDKHGEADLEKQWDILLHSLDSMLNDQIIVRFDEEAQSTFDFWREETTVQAHGMEPHLSAHVGKSYEFVAALAVYLFLYEANGRIFYNQQISVDYILRAIKLGEYFLSHAKRMYGLAYKDDISARSLANKLSLLGHSFTRSQIRDRDWANLTQKEQRQEAIGTLIKRGYISEQTHGRFYINPKCLEE